MGKLSVVVVAVLLATAAVPSVVRHKFLDRPVRGEPVEP